MTELKQQHQRPEGRVIEDALKRPPKKSMRKLADEVGLSEGRVRQIINGYQSMGGQIIAIVGPADTVARLAQAAGVTPEQMRSAGRPDAADVMSPLRGVGVTEEGDLWISDHELETEDLVEWLGRPENERGRPPTRSLVLWDTEQLLEAAAERHRDEIRLLQHFVDVLGQRPSMADHEALLARVRELEGGDNVAQLPLSEPPDRTDTSIAADEGESPIERGQGHDEHP